MARKKKKWYQLPEKIPVGGGMNILTHFPEDLMGKTKKVRKKRVTKRKRTLGVANLEGLTGGLALGTLAGGMAGGIVGGVAGTFGANYLAKQILKKKKRR